MPQLHERFVVLFSIVGSLLTAIHLFFSIRVAMKRQELAYAGDAAAAKRIILPCYKPLVRGLLVFYLMFAVALALTFVNPDVDVHRIIQYYCFSLLTTYCITPVMLVQTSVSANAFWRIFYTIFPYWALNTLLFGLVDIPGEASVVFSALFIVCTALPPLCLSSGILTKTISSRVQLGSNSNRNTTEILLVYSLSFGVVFSVGISCDHHNSTALPGHCNYATDIIMILLTFIINQLYPFALYRTLLADTKFWRGVGKHNQGGFLVEEALRATGVNIHRPTMEFNVASTTFQSMMADIHDLTIDFAFLALEKEIGQGATARVFCGKYKKKMVAVKLSTPPEITEDVLDVFVAEAKISSLFRHRNIVHFLGICVRPPQIGMVFEFCDGGALKTHLQKNPTLWTPYQRIRGCLDAARAVEHLHSHGYIHRDIKADNFFVSGRGKKLSVKLGDFGEATRIPHIRYSERLSQSTMEKSMDSDATPAQERRSSLQQQKRMTILGTVAFMAPELVNNARTYTESIDIYALGVTFWEIWTGQDPYDGCTTFQIYDIVKRGERPPLPQDSPAAFQSILTKMWLEDTSQRPTASEVVQMLEACMSDLLNNGNGDPSQPSTSMSGSVREEDEDDDDRSRATSNPIFSTVSDVLRTVSRRYISGDNNGQNSQEEPSEGRESYAIGGGISGALRRSSMFFGGPGVPMGGMSGGRRGSTNKITSPPISRPTSVQSEANNNNTTADSLQQELEGDMHSTPTEDFGAEAGEKSTELTASPLHTRHPSVEKKLDELSQLTETQTNTSRPTSQTISTDSSSISNTGEVLRLPSRRVQTQSESTPDIVESSEAGGEEN